MFYEIMRTTDTQNDQTVTLNKAGNKYTICFQRYSEDELIYKSKCFDSIESAMLVYVKFVDAIATGCYSAKDRESWIA